MAENEDANPWEPLHVERGFDQDVTTVTVIGAEGPQNINDHFSKDGLGIMMTVAGTIANTGANSIFYKTESIIALCPEHAGLIAADGYSKRDIKDYLYKHATIPKGRFAPEVIKERVLALDPPSYVEGGPETPVRIVRDADDFMIVVLGGAGKHSMFLPKFGATRAVTRPLLRADGQFAMSVDEFKS